MTAIAFAVDAVSDAPEYDGSEIRGALSVFSSRATDARPLGAVSGVRFGTDEATVNVSSFTWYVEPHAGLIDEHTAAGTGPYMYAVTAQETGTVTAADGTHPRVDIIYVQIDDPSADATSVPAVNVGYTAGTAAASPSAPATPDRSLVLAEINVPASGGGDPTATWKAQVAVAAGAIVPVPNDTARNALAAAVDVDSYRPLYVHNAGNSAGRRLQSTEDGSTWNTFDARSASLTTSGVVTAATGWTVSSEYGYIRSGIAFVTIVATRTGSTIAAPTTGDITNTLVATLASGWRPAAQLYPAMSHGHNGRGAFGYAEASGAINVSSVAAGVDLSTGQLITLSGSWPVA